MGIDGIGKRGAPPASPVTSEKAGGAGGVAGAEKAAFQVPDAQPTNVQAAQSAQASEPSALSRVRSGDISVNQYLDLKVDEATSHLEAFGPLPPAQKNTIKEALRSQMATDPALADLVQQATGHLPEPSES